MPQPGSTEPTLGPTWPKVAFSLAMVRSHIVANTLPPPIAKPCTLAMDTLRRSRRAVCISSMGMPTVPRGPYRPSSLRCTFWSPPVQKALSPAPESTITLALFSSSARRRPSMSSSSVWLRKALYTSGRLMVMFTTPSRTS